MSEKSKMTAKLNCFAKNITSQHGEDGIIDYILKHVPPVTKICVDIGAWDGKVLSNIYSLWHDQGWKAVLLEGDKNKSDNIMKNYADFEPIVVNKYITPKGEDSLDSIFEKHKIDSNIGVLSIDIDSADYYVWKYLTYVKPSIVIIEHNHTIPAYVNYKDPEGEVFLRASAKALEELGIEKGYKLICCTGTNSIFIKNEFFDNQYFPDLPVEALFDYSNCSIQKLSADTSTTNNNIINVYYGKPSKSRILKSHIKKIYDTVCFRTNKKPSERVIEACNNSGIYIC
ncbi:MAG: hypothetical protein PHD97_02610 [Bacteroidales bacterium]|nr:hypothetical protein [Bacteroidales bacterium]